MNLYLHDNFYLQNTNNIQMLHEKFIVWEEILKLITLLLTM